MKHALLLLLFVPQIVFAYREDPRIPKLTLYAGVKSVDVTYIFILKSGNDTGMNESFQYNELGFLTDYTYNQHLEKNPPYTLNTTYRYQSKDAWTQMTYKNKKLSDSIVVRNGWANWYNWQNGIFDELHEYRGDSAREKVVKDGDTIDRGNRIANKYTEPFWDYYHAGAFAKKETRGSGATDTTRYFNSKGECLTMFVNFYDSNKRPVKTDYYNFKVKRFDLFYWPYSEKMDMIFFLNKSKKGNWSFEITRKFDDKGRVSEEFFTDAHPYKGGNGTPVKKIYSYTTY